MSNKRMKLGNDSTTVDFQTNGNVIVGAPVYGEELPGDGEEGQVFFKTGEDNSGAESSNWIVNDSSDYSITSIQNIASPSFNISENGNKASLFGYVQPEQQNNTFEVFGNVFAHGEANALKQTNDINHSLEMYTGSTNGETVGFRDRVAGEWWAYLNSISGEREMYIPHKLRLEGHSSAIGTIASTSNDSYSLENNTYVNVASLQLSAGTWVIIGRVEFAINGTGRRELAIIWDGSNNKDRWVTAAGLSSDTVDLNNVTTATFTSTTNVHAQIQQTSGVSLNTWTFLKAVRIA